MDRPLALDSEDVACPPRPLDVYLCHSGCAGQPSKLLLLDHVSTELQKLPVDNGGVIDCLFRVREDSDDLEVMVGQTQTPWQAAICQASIGAR